MSSKVKNKNPIKWKKELEWILIECLIKASVVHDELGASGEEVVQKNQFGDTALQADIKCEGAVLCVLSKIGVPIRIISEEHGQVDITENPRYLGILDGLDGSSVYNRARGQGRYATMFGIFDTIDPMYQDNLVSGVMEHSTKRLFIAIKNRGAFIIEGNKKTPIHSSSRTQLSSNIYIDEYFEINRSTFSDKLQSFKPKSRGFSSGSSAVHYVDVASGVADLTLECTRKHNLEIAVAYGLLAESGAVMVDLEGVSIGDKKYFDFGQMEQLPIVTAANTELANNLIQYLRI